MWGDCESLKYPLCCVAGVLVLSWYPPGMADDNGEPSDDLVPAILDTAHQYNIQVSLQEEVKCSLAHSGNFPSSTHRDSTSIKVLNVSLGMQIHSKCSVGGEGLINDAYVTLYFFGCIPGPGIDPVPQQRPKPLQ